MSGRVPAMLGVLSIALTVLALGALAQENTNIPRTADGRPDLSGTYDIATLTPLQQTADLGDQLVLTEEEAAAPGQASRTLHVVERLTRIDEYVWPASENKVYKYACHETNNLFGGILLGARVLEADAREAR